MEQLNVRLLLSIAAKVVFWVGYTFLQKPSSFKFLSILEENCVAHINDGAFKCKFLFTNVSQISFSSQNITFSSQFSRFRQIPLLNFTKHRKTTKKGLQLVATKTEKVFIFFESAPGSFPKSIFFYNANINAQYLLSSLSYHHQNNTNDF